MAEPAEEQQEGELAPLGALTTEIMTAYVSKNAVAIADLGDLIETVGRTLVALGREEPKPDTAKPKPAVPVRRSIQEDHLVCLVCGKRQTTLRRHLEIAHQLTPEAYREQFGLRPDYPMAAPGRCGEPSLTPSTPSHPQNAPTTSPTPAMFHLTGKRSRVPPRRHRHCVGRPRPPPDHRHGGRLPQHGPSARRRARPVLSRAPPAGVP